MRAKKALSQNWLIDANLANKLVDALQLKEGDEVLEVGPGTGALTTLLLERGAKVVAVELDEDCVQFLRQKFDGHPRLRLISGDFLDYPLDQLGLSDNCSFISNLPYAITTPILFRVIEGRHSFNRIVVTMQKEVAQRLTAKTGTKEYGRLTVMLAVYGQVKKLFDLPPSVFRPSPNVTSTALLLQPQPADWLTPQKWQELSKLVKIAFSTRRKTIAKSISRELGLPLAEVREMVVEAGFDNKVRPEKLSAADFIRLCAMLSPHLC